MFIPRRYLFYSLLHFLQYVRTVGRISSDLVLNHRAGQYISTSSLLTLLDHFQNPDRSADSNQPLKYFCRKHSQQLLPCFQPSRHARRSEQLLKLLIKSLQVCSGCRQTAKSVAMTILSHPAVLSTIRTMKLYRTPYVPRVTLSARHSTATQFKT